MHNQKKLEINQFFEELEKQNGLDFTFSNIDVEEIDLNNPFDSIQELLQENGDFDIEIMYYTEAIEYLRKNDPSLRNSLEIAATMGFSVKNLTSEKLASLLASEEAKEEFSNLKNEIEDFFNNLS